MFNPTLKVYNLTLAVAWILGSAWVTAVRGFYTDGSNFMLGGFLLIVVLRILDFFLWKT